VPKWSWNIPGCRQRNLSSGKSKESAGTGEAKYGENTVRKIPVREWENTKLEN
jgi:hypothetical protein